MKNLEKKNKELEELQLTVILYLIYYIENRIKSVGWKINYHLILRNMILFKNKRESGKRKTIKLCKNKKEFIKPKWL